jgi:YD repeat-containing protein
LNQLVEATETMGSVTDTTTYIYNSLGDLISVTDPEDKTTRFTYDAYGDVISMVDPNAGTTTFAYFTVPEPSTWTMILLGFAGLALAGRMTAKRGAPLSA